MTTGQMFDSASWEQIPTWAPFVAVYINGLYEADMAEVKARFPNARIYSIDVNGSDPGASIKDVENFDISPSNSAGVVEARYKEHPDAKTRLYCNKSTWPAVKSSVATLPANVRGTVRYWIADPTGVPHILPGADATQYLWHGSAWDESLINYETFA